MQSMGKKINSSASLSYINSGAILILEAKYDEHIYVISTYLIQNLLLLAVKDCLFKKCNNFCIHSL
jgi:hypothetical protein